VTPVDTSGIQQLVNEPSHANGVLSFLHRRNLQIPRNLSLITLLTSAELEWWQPPPAHFRVRFGAYPREILRWLKGVEQGRQDRKHTPVPWKYVAEESIAPPRK
jgi:hypothetical protein